MEDYYQTLGVSQNASQEEIKKRYRFLAKAYHPDRFTDNEAKNQAQGEMQKLNQAYEILSDPVKRAKYDQQNLQDQEVGKIIDEMINYLIKVGEKWRSNAVELLQIPEISSNMEVVHKILKSLINSAYLGISNDLIISHVNEVEGALIQGTIMSISLGLEKAARGLPPEYDEVKLQLLAFLPLIIMIEDIQNEAYKDNGRPFSEINQLGDQAEDAIITLAKICEQAGSIRIKFMSGAARTRPLEPPTERRPAEPLHRSDQGICSICLLPRKTAQVAFVQIIGMIVVFHSSEIKGNLCARCAEERFWKYTIITLMFGWWGITSAFITPILLISNIWNYGKTFRIRDESDFLDEIARPWKAIAIVLAIIVPIVIAVSYLRNSISLSQGYQLPVATTRSTPKTASISPPTSAVRSSSPKISTAQQARTWFEQRMPFLDQMAFEEETHNGYNYRISSLSADPVLWGWGWCAIDTKTLNDNLSKLLLNFYVNDQLVPVAYLNTYFYDGEIDVQGQGVQTARCGIVYMGLYSWPSGAHRLLIKAVFLSPANDGWFNFPKNSTFTDEYYVYRPSQASTQIPANTTKTAESQKVECILWSKITTKDSGRYLCVYGVITSFSSDDDKTVIKFSESSSSFQFWVLDGGWGLPGKGTCVMAYGPIGISSSGIRPIMMVKSSRNVQICK
ncbi:MAG: J domain-containing protein [Anaerolineales bacterium]|nr:J domain-containing protein [Anaerolineales bacterium]